MVDFEIKDKYNVDDFRKIMEVLRAPGGCPWDAEQTHESIRRNVLEEAYEVAQAIDKKDAENLKEELGDLLMQVLFHARMEEEKGVFNLDDVADAAVKKLVFRHPHVFGNVKADTPEQVLDTWDAVKRIEKSQDTVASAMSDVAESLPALWRAEKVQKKAAKVGFDWPDVSGAMDKLREETEELSRGIESGDHDNIEEEIGDVLFSAVNAARFLKVDPEQALHRSCEKFIRRFKYIEQAAIKSGKAMEELSLDEQEALYQQGRREEKL
jgi:tetrapyrrole methylase family protein/MazG family protein